MAVGGAAASGPAPRRRARCQAVVRGPWWRARSVNHGYVGGQDVACGATRQEWSRGGAGPGTTCRGLAPGVLDWHELAANHFTATDDRRSCVARAFIDLKQPANCPFRRSSGATRSAFVGLQRREGNTTEVA